MCYLNRSFENLNFNDESHIKWKKVDEHILQLYKPQLDGALLKIVSEYDQEIPQSQTADYPVAPRGRADQPSRDTRKTN